MKRLFKVLFLTLISLSFACISCSGTVNSTPDSTSGKTEVSYTVHIEHLLTGDAATFTKSNVTVTAFYDDDSSEKVTDFTIEPETFDVAVGGTEFTFKRGTDTKTYTVYKASYVTSDVPTDIEYDGSWSTAGTYCKFGDYPQSKNTDSTLTFSNEPAKNGWYIGSDGNYYDKVGTATSFYKVEPIVWRKADTDYNSTGKTLLIAETILEAGIPYYYSSAGNYEVPKNLTEEEALKNALANDSKVRFFTNGVPTFSNNYEYSGVRAFLNGYDYYDLNKKAVSDYKNNGFLQKAFSTIAQNSIAETTVINNGDTGKDPGNSGIQPIDATSSIHLDLTSNDTKDKVFLLSHYETVSVLSDSGASGEGEDNKRKRSGTDYAKLKGVADSAYMTRTPYYKNGCSIRYVNNIGTPYYTKCVNDPSLGIVPAVVVD